MGKPTGFMEYERRVGDSRTAAERTGDYGEFHAPLPREAQQVQAARCMDCGVPFCQSGMLLGGMASGCPLHNLIPEWNDLVFAGKWELALRRLERTNCFPEFTGRVCPALCEAACTCGHNGESVSIRENELAIIEQAFALGNVQPRIPAVRTDRRVAVVGSGPSGLAAAQMLCRRGHSVTVYERADRPGGLLMYGIPNMKLEKRIVQRRVALMEAEGVAFSLGVDVGRDISPEELLARHDAIILACGACEPRDISAPGRDAAGVHFAVEYLSSVTRSLLDSDFANSGAISAKDRDVVVIGGGDTGNDCVGTAIRQGARSVVQLEMMPCPPEERTEGNGWPQWPRIKKTDYGQEEAAALFGSDPRIFEATVKEFVADAQGNLEKIIARKLDWKKDKKTGRMAGTPREGSEFEIPCQLALIAAGFLGSQRYVPEAFGAEIDQRQCVQTEQYATSVPGVFAAGDMRRGQSLVVWAIREGQECAAAVDAYLMGYTNL